MRDGVALQKARLLYRVAQAYYEQNLTQAEIAQRFGISRIKVSRMLTRARDEGVVRISVVAPPGGATQLEHALESAFGLDEAIVADPTGHEYQDVVEAIGRAAAEYLNRVLEDGHTLGLTWGNTVLATVTALDYANLPECRVVQLLGGLGNIEAEVHGAELVRRAAERLGGKARNIHAPGIVASRSVRDALIADSGVRDTLELGKRSDIALLGIGAFGPHSVLRGHGSVLSGDDCRTLQELGVVGDIALRFYDADGLPVVNPYTDRTIGIDLPDLKHIPRRVGIAGGREKEPALRAALTGRWVNVLVTDLRTATALLEQEG